jgi:outer membrane protein with beta-barrel domain
MRLRSSVFLALGFLGALALPANADDGPRADIAGGYSLIYAHDIKTTFPAGWFASAAVNVTNVFAIAGEVSGHYKSTDAANTSLRVHTYLAGPRFVAGTGAARLFVEVLAGGATTSAGVNVPSGGTSVSAGGSETDFCYMPAVGLDIGFNRETAMRIGAGERLILVSGGSTFKEFQFVAGLVLRFDK